MDRYIKPIYEFIVWDNCNNNCKFCWQKQHFKLKTSAEKVFSLVQVKKFLTSDDFKSGSHVLIVGGELFDSSSIPITQELLDFFEYIANKQLTNDIDLLYLNTNLIYDIDLLCNCLDILNNKNLLNRLKFTTSYDIYGRFKSKNDEMLFVSNLKKLKTIYSDLSVVINTIMTKQFCEKELSAVEPIATTFKSKYAAYVNLIPYITIDDELTPNRNDVFKVLKKQDQFNPGYLKQYIENFDLPQPKLIYRALGNKLVFSSSEYADCGHGINFKRYSNKGTCFICDIKEAFSCLT